MKKWRNLILATLGFAFLGVALSCACASKQAVAMVRAEGEEIVEVVEEQPEEKESWIKKSYDTLIVPLFAGVSLTTVGGILFTVAFTLIKNKQFDKRMKAVVEMANEKYQLAEEKLVKISEIYADIKSTYQLVLQSDKVNSETKQFLEEKVGYAVTVVDGVQLKVNKIDDLIKAISLLTQLDIEVVLSSPSLVKSGLSEKVSEIKDIVTHL